MALAGTGASGWIPNCSDEWDEQKLCPIEKALVGTPVLDSQRLLEILRVIHSFDLCLACVVHVCRPSAAIRLPVI